MPSISTIAIAWHLHFIIYCSSRSSMIERIKHSLDILLLNFSFKIIKFQIVAPFYAFWSNFSTRRSFAWLDKWDLRDAPDRQTTRAMEKDNKKLRELGRRERSEEIRVIFLHRFFLNLFHFFKEIDFICSKT